MRKKKEDDSEPRISNYSKKKNSVHLKKKKIGISILTKHQEKLAYFHNKQKIIKEIDTKLEILFNKLKKSKEQAAICVANSTFDMTFDISIDSITTEITKLKQTRDELIAGKTENEYLLNVYSIIDDYIKIEEEEENLSILDPKEKEQKLFELCCLKSQLTDEYLRITQVSFCDTTEQSYRKLYDKSGEYCQKCNGILTAENGVAVCRDCGSCFSCIHEAQEPSYREMQELDYRTQFSYDKRSHLSDWLRRFQAKENKEIPQEILDKIIKEAKKERNTGGLTESKVKQYLKRLNLNEYYDNVISIINRIENRRPFILTPEIEYKIMEMFQKIQEPFMKFKESTRRNMLSYSYLLNKLFLILGLPEFSKYFTLLKSPEKLRQQDETFKKIIDYMVLTDPGTPWKFFPST